MKKIAAIVMAGCMIVGLTACSWQSEEEQTPAARDFFAMNTYIRLEAYGDGAEDALALAQARIEELEGLWSVTDETSEIYAVNHSGGQPVSVSEDTAELVSFALEMAEKTGGALEPTIYPVLTAWGFTTNEHRVPSQEEIDRLLASVDYRRVSVDGNTVQLEPDMMLDLGAVGKGYASDEVAALLREEGITSALLDLGGNIMMIGSRPDGGDWRLGLKDPFADENIGILEVSDCAVVTSGNYENYFSGADGRMYGHIINSRTGYPADNGLASVTIISQDGKLCDSLSTALFVMGKDGAVDYWRDNPEFEMILVDSERQIYVTEGIADAFTPLENTAAQVIQV